MPARDKYVFTWKDEALKAAYVFWGPDGLPAMLWKARHRRESALNDWLRTLDQQPETKCFADALYGNQARTLVAMFSKKLAVEGYTILSSRDRSTIKAGYQPARWIKAIVNGRQQMFRSVRAASRALGLTPSAVTLAAQNPTRKDISYA